MRRELARWFKWPHAPAATPVDAADMGTEFGLELSLAESASPSRPASRPVPAMAGAPRPAWRLHRSVRRGWR